MIQTVMKVAVAGYSGLAVRAGTEVQIGDEKIAIFKLTNGDVRAVENRSPHPKGGVLSEGLVSGNYVFCPVYDWKISLVDGKVQAPDIGQVKTYEVLVEADEVYILLG
ncbi:nitrite reductase small subunit NirD [Neobacillus sp. PS3-34]|uniref:nitrite reductase small subunit NirD n=1 Tax=Neobacillus sp. PS3-34 TaxID=3070678 RepID=UPI0027E1810B|nr:nitrite reductase small subunit NirD [Neobacillus sp. PS3-34]WML50132.1 nitrite reductase small subunit NirD [Neobacillus sp. PS3-34]